jgi:hypothetical protein
MAHANDNGVCDERPVVRVPVGRPEQAYAHQGNLILPLRFARLMPGWQVAGAASPEAAAPATPPTPRRTATSRRPSPAPLWRLARRRAPASR